MNRALRLLATMAAASVLFWGCAKRQVNIEKLPLPSLPELVAKTDQNSGVLRDFSGGGSVEMSGPELRRTVLGLRVDYLAPDHLSLKFKGPLGVNAGSLILAGDFYRVNLPSEHRTVTGRVSEFEFNLGLDLVVSGEDLRGLFQPLIKAEDVPDSVLIERDVDARQFRLAWSDALGDYRLWADPSIPLFIRELISKQGGDTLWYKQLGGIKKRDKVFLPNAWTVIMGQGEDAYRIKLKLPELLVNTGLSPQDFKIEAISAEAQGG
jgi:hypothetical protein